MGAYTRLECTGLGFRVEVFGAGGGGEGGLCGLGFRDVGLGLEDLVLGLKDEGVGPLPARFGRFRKDNPKVELK